MNTFYLCCACIVAAALAIEIDLGDLLFLRRSVLGLMNDRKPRSKHEIQILLARRGIVKSDLAVQLCLNELCLEGWLGQRVVKGTIYYFLNGQPVEDELVAQTIRV